ncbi:hypothetical protein H5410_060916 [Solanum commersonii]|uniref:Uncharacterized protein n=1 Tax=Solanum commersonii TaxID=4109 RepID=A0A9J5W800_SOLCO|nr:hypothetical protein H5410_060916 [Solanum commersonii]
MTFKEWQYLWPSIDNVVYDNEEYGHSDISTVHKFITLMDNVLPLLSCSTIQKFSLNFVFKYNDGVSYFPVIDKWLEFDVNKKEKDLRLDIRYRTVYPTGHNLPYSFPDVLCSSSLWRFKPLVNYENLRLIIIISEHKF